MKIKLKEVPNTKEHNKTWVDAFVEARIGNRISNDQIIVDSETDALLVASYVAQFEFGQMSIRHYTRLSFSSTTKEGHDEEATYEDAVLFLKQRGKL